MSNCPSMSRRSALTLVVGIGALIIGRGEASERSAVTIHKDPNCGCCTGWAQHLAKAGFEVKTVDTTRLDEVKKRLGVPLDLAACHTAEVDGYVVEGHVPALALKRFLSEKPDASGLAVPGMPIGSPGMEGGTPEIYTVILFGPNGRQNYMRFLGNRAV